MEYISSEFFKQIKFHVCQSVCLSFCQSNPSCDIPICMTQAAVTLCLVCICLQNLFKDFYGLLRLKIHKLNQLLHLLKSQESQGRQPRASTGQSLSLFL